MEKTFKIEGMSCGHCVSAIQRSLSKLNLGKINVKIGSVEIKFDEDKVSENEIVKAIEAAGYPVIK